MDDLISRAAAIDALYNWSEHSMTDAEAWHIRQVIGDIKSMPSAQRWIPCNERLPKVREWVLCQCRAGIMDVLRLTDDNGWFKDSTHIYMHRFVLAWMPLPEPWEGEQNG